MDSSNTVFNNMDPVLSDSDESDHEDHDDGPPSAAQKQSIQNARFKSWMLQEAQGQIINASKTPQNAQADQYSMRALMLQSTPKIISSPREYQLELFERAKQKNIIAVLDTGTGKTLIAVLLLRHILDQELEDRQAGKSPRISFFVVSLSFHCWSMSFANLC